MNIKRNTAALAAALCLCEAVSCGKSDPGSDSNVKPADTSASDETTSVSGESSSSDWLGNRISPDEDAEEYDLGEYYISPDGIKLYFEPEEFPAELMLTLEKYFTAYANRDYTSYSSCVYPSYFDEMNKFLEKDYSYDLSTSFSNQCDTLKVQIGGDFTVTRIKLEPYEGDLTSFFESPSSCFGKDYYTEVSAEVDKFYDAMFFIIAKDSEGEEHSLVSEYEIVFAEKDGKYYIFG
ncbi:MAG: hypothetical protein IKO47_02290 [Ruminococcus sp.]|nr:hypothetical protein [Ruminococcus sp.]